MTPSLVFSVWTSTSSSRDPEAESVSEEDAKVESELSIKLARKMLCNGSKRNTTVQFIIDLYKLIICIMNSLFSHMFTPEKRSKKDFDLSMH